MAKKSTKNTIKKGAKIINVPRVVKQIRRSARIKNGKKTKAIRKDKQALKQKSIKIRRKLTSRKKKEKKVVIKVKKNQIRKVQRTIKKKVPLKLKNPPISDPKIEKKAKSQRKNRSQTKSKKSKSKLKKQASITPITNQKRDRKPSNYFKSLQQKQSIKKSTTIPTKKMKLKDQQGQKSQEVTMTPNPIKSISELQRIKRSQNQRIFLIAAERKPQQWSFKVMGTKGSLYQVIISTKVKCNCIDYRTNRKPCKHIYFIATQVAKNNQILSEFQTKAEIHISTYAKLDEYLVQSLRRFIEKEGNPKTQEINLKDDKDCAVCFCEMEATIQRVEQCSVCKKYFHEQCLTVWKKVNNSCPLCRSVFQKKAENSLEKLQGVILGMV